MLRWLDNVFRLGVKELASLASDKIPYFRDDVMDDARYSGWLVGRDQDRKFLLEVFDAIIRDRANVPQRRREAA